MKYSFMNNPKVIYWKWLLRSRIKKSYNKLENILYIKFQNIISILFPYFSMKLSNKIEKRINNNIAKLEMWLMKRGNTIVQYYKHPKLKTETKERWRKEYLLHYCKLESIYLKYRKGDYSFYKYSIANVYDRMRTAEGKYQYATGNIYKIGIGKNSN